MHNITIYTTPTCHYCKMAKAFFQEKGVAYQEFDVLADMTKRQEMVEKSGQMGVPVITVDDQVVIGFDEAKLSQLLA